MHRVPRLHATRALPLLAVAVLAMLILGACRDIDQPLGASESFSVLLTLDGETRALTTSATNVRELLEQEGIPLNPTDEISPPLFTPLSDELEIVVVRITEDIVLIERSVPFERTVVRNESMQAGEPPLLVQSGRAGLEELTVRIVYRDGLEAERQTLQVAVINEARDEIVMVGIGSTPGNVLFPGTLAFISGGRGLILRGASAFPEQLNLGGTLDGRVFALSPTGEYLLYTRTATDEDFNQLFYISTAANARPRALDVRNVLWAGWNPAAVSTPQFAYTTAIPTDLPPGWEANNDLWLGALPLETGSDFEPIAIVEAYPAKFAWWGGNYAWSPTGRYIAYSYADEVGILDLNPGDSGFRRRQLQEFVEYDTLSDWVWVPSLTWSPDGRYLAFTSHGGSSTQDLEFNTWVSDIASGVLAEFVPDSGIWSHPHWSPRLSTIDPVDESRIAYLRATNPLDNIRSSYTLWMMDQDGSNGEQIFPAPGENSNFPREQQILAWGPNGSDVAFIFNASLYLLNIETRESQRITLDESNLSNPTWAPYGQASGTDLVATEIVPLDSLPQESQDELEEFLNNRSGIRDGQ